MIDRRWMVNGSAVSVAFEDGDRLLDVLRDRLGLVGTKEGCGEGECGACTVLIDGRLTLSCLTLGASLADGARILTVEGLAADPIGARLQRAFLEVGAVQCGYCTPGMLLAALALLESNPDPSSGEIRTALAGNLCRCTGYAMIVEAVRAAGNAPAGEGGPA